jgi:alkanesulfonate monooxygenase SsuD/methylene tetrahydromethanopterin reductase-like flavin-dependent oxidoreductase (luciferase family)
MRFGIILNGGQRAGQPREEALAALLAKARTAQQCGFHSLWVGPGYLDDGWHATVLLARVAAEAPGLELGVVGLLPLVHPVELAEQLATLDVISGGRLVLAAALGWRDFQFRAFQVPSHQRLSRFLEVLEVMHKLWTQQRVTHHGRHFHLEDVPGAGAPLQSVRRRLHGITQSGWRNSSCAASGPICRSPMRSRPSNALGTRCLPRFAA